MKCPECGEEIEEGKLYCEHCGHEIRIVPDFDTSAWENIEETMTGIIGEVFPEEAEKRDEDSETDHTSSQKSGLSPKQISVLLAVLIPLIIAGILAAVMIPRKIRKDRENMQEQSADYQISMAVSSYLEGDYEATENYYLKALKLDPYDYDTYMSLLGLYQEQGKTNAYILLLQKMMGSEELDINQKSKALKLLVSEYEKEQAYNSIISVLDEYPYTLPEEYLKYYAVPPKFSYESGAYSEDIPLKIYSDSEGEIRYTLDNTPPGKATDLYESLIFLGEGHHVVRAVTINAYGIISEETVGEFDIEIIRAAEPEISLYSGKYIHAQKIIVEVPEGCTVYYSTDGSVPGTENQIYNGPIDLPLGVSYFMFTAINESGVSSDTVSMQYELEISAMDRQKAMELVLRKMVESGQITTLYGLTPDGETRYILECRSARAYGETDYYLLAEMHDAEVGYEDTGVWYAVNTETEEVYKLMEDETGAEVLVSFTSF